MWFNSMKRRQEEQDEGERVGCYEIQICAGNLEEGKVSERDQSKGNNIRGIEDAQRNVKPRANGKVEEI